MSKKNRQSRRQQTLRSQPRLRRALRAEPLEDRVLLAADLFHNAAFPLDTNMDQMLTPNDALGVINALNNPAAPSEAEAEGGDRALDVNDDGVISPRDALNVINGLNNGEGETGPVLRVITRIFARPLNYPTVQATEEIASIGVGQDFVVKLLVEDVRSMGTREGVFSTYVDVNFDNPAVASLVPSLPGVTHPQTGNPTPYLHNNMDPNEGDFLFGERAEPVNGNGLIDTDGNGSLDQLDFIGSFSGRLRGPGPGEFVLVEWAMTADTAGSLTIEAEPTTENPSVDPNDANESPLFDPGIFGQDAPVCPSVSTTDPCMGEMEFVADSITVVDRISAIADVFDISEGAGPQTFDVLANDINNTQGDLTITSTTQGTLGSVFSNGDTVTYTPGANASGTDMFTYTISNGLGDSSTGDVTVNINPINDPPINSVPGAQTTDEDTSLSLPPISVSDADGNVNLTVSLDGSLGTISVPVTSGVTITNPDSSNVSLDGLLNDVNNALNSLTYTPNLNANGAGSLTITSDDGIESDTDTVNITINPINDAPVNTVPGPTTLFNTDTLPFGAGAFQVSDVDASSLEVTLTVSQGTVNLTTTNGLQVSGNNTTSLTATGSISNLNSGLGSLIYDPIDTFVGTETLTMTTSDLGQTGAGGTLTDTDTVSITVTPPETPFAASDFYDVEEDPTSPLTFNLSDLLSNDIRPMPTAENTLTLTAINGSSPSDGSFSTGSGFLSFNDSSGTFTYSPQTDFFGLDTFTYTIESSPNAGDGPSTGTVNIDVLPINDGPINSIPGGLEIDEDNSLTFSGANLISISDVDAGAAGVTVTLSVNNGTLNVGGNSAGSLVLDGTVSQINNQLGGLTYSPDLNYAGSDTLTINTDDHGNTGGLRGDPFAANPLFDNDTVNITIQPINDAPVLVVPGNQTFITDFDNVLSSNNNNAFSIDDVDAGNADVQVDLTIGDGTLTISDTGSLSSVSGNGSNSLTLQGSVTNINSVLSTGVTYRTTASGNKSLSATVNDLGNTGGVAGDPTAINPLTHSDSVAIEVLDFVPSNIGGFVYVDINNDANKGSGEVGLEGVRITLNGTTFRNTPVNLETWTLSNGSYLFPNLEPGSYMLGQDQPANVRTGTNSFVSPVVSAGGDKANVAIPIAGNIDSRNNNFAERGLTTPFLSMFDLLDSQFQRSAVLISSDASTHWSAFLGVDGGWSGYSNPRLDAALMTLTITDANSTDRVVDLRGNDPANHGSTLMDRIRTRRNGDNQVIRILGTASDFGLTNGAGEGEGGDVAAAPPAETNEMYAQAVDQVFGEMA